MNLRKDHCRNLPSRTTREHVSTLGGGGSFDSPPSSRKAKALRVAPRRFRLAKPSGCTKQRRELRQGILTKECSLVAPETVCVRAVRLFSMSKRLSATDISALASMKNVAKCDTWCELQNPVNHRVFERKLRPKPLGRGHVCLGVTRRCPSKTFLRGRKGRKMALPCGLSRGWPKYKVHGVQRRDNRWLSNLGSLSRAKDVRRVSLTRVRRSLGAFNATPGQAGLPAEFKHINKRRKRNLQGFP